jgi:hypothetical protein
MKREIFYGKSRIDFLLAARIKTQPARVYLVVIEQKEITHKTRKLNPFDAGMVVVILLAACGFGLARAGHAGVDSAITGKGALSIDVMFTGIKTLDVNMFKVGDSSAITIRNQPVTPPMTITKVLHWPKQVAFLSPDGKKAVAMADPSNPIAHDFLVTVREDHADQTSDGWVIRGNKIKVGNQIELESDKYRVQGVVADIHVPNDSNNANALKELETATSAPKKNAK